MDPAIFDQVARGLATGLSRRRALLSLSGAAVAGLFRPARRGHGSGRNEQLAQAESTPIVVPPVFDPIYVSPDPFSLGDDRYLLDGQIFSIDPAVAIELEGTPTVQIQIDGEIVFIDPAIAASPSTNPEASPTAGDATPTAPPLETPCGADDSEDVEAYRGLLGVPRPFVDQAQGPVGNLRWNADLIDRYQQPGTVNNRRWCSGTLIANDLFLTAGHCFSQDPNGFSVPSIDGKDEPIPRAEIATNMHVDFHYQLDPRFGEQPFESFPVVELVEDQLGDLDYAIVRLDGNPGLKYGTARVAAADVPVGETICIIGHPEGLPKRVEAGSVSLYDAQFMFYNDIDTAGGSSGSGLLASPGGPIVGIHTTGGCNAERTGNNAGVRISSLLQVSSLLSAGATTQA